MDEQQKQRVVRQIATALAECAEELGVAAIRELAAINAALGAAEYPDGEAGVRSLLGTLAHYRGTIDSLQRRLKDREALHGSDVG